MRILAINYPINHPYVDYVQNIAASNKFQDYDVVIADPWPVETILGIEQNKSGTGELEAAVSEHIKNLLDERFSEGSAFLRNGGLVVCVFRPTRQDNYGWFLRASDPTQSLPIKLGADHRLGFVDEESPFAPYLQLAGITVHAYWSGAAVSRSLAWDVADRIVALVIQEGSGQLVLLPECTNPDKGQVLVNCLRGALSFPQPEEEETPPAWVEAYRLQIEDKLEEEREQISFEIERLRQVRAATVAKIRKVKALNQLLWGTGHALEEAVREAFEQLGFSTKRHRRVDLLIESDLGMAFVEVVGSEHVIRIRKIDQLGGYIADWGSSTAKGVLVGNAFKSNPLNDRPPTRDWFSTETVESARNRDCALLTTIDLYHAVEQVLGAGTDELSATIQHAIFDACGLCDLNAVLQND